MLEIPLIDHDYDEIQGKGIACVPDLKQKFINLRIHRQMRVQKSIDSI